MIYANHIPSWYKYSKVTLGDIDIINSSYLRYLRYSTVNSLYKVYFVILSEYVSTSFLITCLNLEMLYIP